MQTAMTPWRPVKTAAMASSGIEIPIDPRIISFWCSRLRCSARSLRSASSASRPASRPSIRSTKASITAGSISSPSSLRASIAERSSSFNTASSLMDGLWGPPATAASPTPCGGSGYVAPDGSRRRTMSRSRAPAAGVIALALGLVTWPASAAAQTVPACAPERTLAVKLTSEERGSPAALVATHDVAVSAEFTGTTVNETYAPPPGVKVTGSNSSGLALVVPSAPSVAITVSWRQAVDPSDPSSDPSDPAQSCTASSVVTLPIVPARPSHAVKLRGWSTGLRQGFSDFAVVPALKQPDLSPLEISARTTSKARLPAASAPARTMSVPMRTVDQVKYARKLPDPFNIGVAERCRLYLLTCGSVFTEVGRPSLDDAALARGIERADVNGSLTLLARSQPSREAARYGVVIEARPGGVRAGSPRPFGYDVQVRQSGRLVARVRVAGRCVERRESRGLVVRCRIARRSAELH
jgi:hypothetical protein